MERRIRRRRWASRESAIFWFCLGLLTVSFLGGVILGHVLVGEGPESVDTELERYLTDYCALGGTSRNAVDVFLSALTIYFRYPIPAFLLGFAAPGVCLIPALSAACGFFLSYSVGCFADVFGRAGVSAAVAVFGLRCLIAVPCFFILAVPALQSACTAAGELLCRRGRRGLSSSPDRSRWLRFILIAMFLLLGALLEAIVSPVLLRLALRQNSF